MLQATNGEESSTVEHVFKCPYKLDNAIMTAKLLREHNNNALKHVHVYNFYFFPFI